MDFVVSNWVARVPGLYWADYSSALRIFADNKIAFKSEEWVEFRPLGKSSKVLGGIGTIRLPPNDDGKRIFSVSSCCNASLGIPILVFPDVIDALSIEEGDVVDINNAKWQALDTNWAQNFATTKDIPRGYLIIDSVDKIIVTRRNVPVAYHPFSIMEYQSNDALLYDFVYVTADTKYKNGRKKIEDFFSKYATKEGRNGSYLLNTDMVQPLFEARYTSPLELQRPSEKAKLELLYRRIHEVNFDKTTLDKLIEILPRYYSNGSGIRMLAKRIDVRESMLMDDDAASMSAQLIYHCMRVGKIEELIDRMCVEYPRIFNH